MWYSLQHKFSLLDLRLGRIASKLTLHQVVPYQLWQTTSFLYHLFPYSASLDGEYEPPPPPETT